MHQAWASLWFDEALAPELLRLKLFWSRACELAPPPPPLDVTLPLLSQLDDAYAVLVRHGIDPAARLPGPPLAEWRAEVCGHLTRLMREAGCLHPAHLPARLAEAVTAGRLRLPSRVVLAALDAPAPAEEGLFEAISRFSKLERLTAAPQAAPHLVSLPRLRDEVEWCAARVLEATNEVAPHDIGVVVPSMDDYGPELDRALGELLGERCNEESWSAYNIAAPKPLAEAPLVRAALLPLRLLAEDEPRELLLALLTSPYFGRWKGVRHLAARADRTWRRYSIERGLTRLLAAASQEGLTRLIEGPEPRLSALLGEFLLRGRASLAVWLERLRGLWRHLGFPDIDGPLDAAAWKRLSEVLERVEAAIGAEVFGLRELHSWLGHALSGEKIDVPGFEHAGVQVLGLIEAAGLHFERLFVLGLHERGLPRPARALPLLHAAERARVRGATWESQLEFARITLEGLLAAGSEVCLCRPRLAADDEPLLASPLWPKGDAERLYVEEHLYAGAPPPWAGFPWLEASQARGNATPSADFEAGVGLPSVVRVTALAGLMDCPFSFLASEVLNLEPLAEPQAGVSPLERGTRLHRALACFTRRFREEGCPPLLAPVLLEECVNEVLQEVGRDPFWQLERRRWLGGGGDSGLLGAWLAEEGDRLTNCLAEEVEFTGLRPEGWPFEVRGKIDRLDGAAGAGLTCWDYKTGGQLEGGGDPLDHPQLAAYGLAVGAGLLSGLPGPLAALGYIHLPRAGGVAVRLLKEPAEGLEAALAAFAAEVGRRAAPLTSGHFPPGWEACLGDRRRRERCPYVSLCGLLERLGEAAEDEP
jgi:RecB family exonuclease